MENYLYIIVAVYVAFFGVLIYYAAFANRGKIRVRVKTPFKEWTTWRKPEADGETIVIDKATKKKAGWSFKFSNKSLVPTKSWGRTSLAIDVFHDSPKAIEYDYLQKLEDQPKWNKNQSQGFIEAKILTKMGQEPKEKTSMAIWLVAGLVIVSIILNVLLSSGRIRIG
jgi:hypothetical protein